MRGREGALFLKPGGWSCGASEGGFCEALTFVVPGFLKERLFLISWVVCFISAFSARCLFLLVNKLISIALLIRYEPAIVFIKWPWHAAASTKLWCQSARLPIFAEMPPLMYQYVERKMLRQKYANEQIATVPYRLPYRVGDVLRQH